MDFFYHYILGNGNPEQPEEAKSENKWKGTTTKESNEKDYLLRYNGVITQIDTEYFGKQIHQLQGNGFLLRKSKTFDHLRPIQKLLYNATSHCSKEF